METKKKEYYRTPNVNCENCGVGVYRRPWQLKKGLIFISCGKCISEVKKQHTETHLGLVKIQKGFKWDKDSVVKRSKKNSPFWKGGMPKCEDCNVELRYSYKSKRCRLCYSKFAKGQNSPNWKGGVTSQEKLERTRFQREIQKQVFERDNYTCQMCGKRGGTLQVDHIQKWSEYVELRFSMDNCRTLCMDCHYFVTFNKVKPKGIVWGHNLKEVLN